ncbi:MAG TPA: M20/M25/M40 family metallo-hydrolase [Longimicrobiales bacterium]|nr:M20/M25/M40 family metallo-hydrolase [Longimicrobiales bacterium]
MTDPLARASVQQVLQQLVRTPSVNPTLAPDEGTGEQAIAAFAVEWLAARGVQAWVDEVAPGRYNAVGAVGPGKRTLAACAHLDTVQTTGMTIPPFEARVDAGRVYGRGSYDMKGGVAAVMSAAAALAQTDFRGRFMLALVADEEYASIGAQDWVQRYQADACVVTEPTADAMRELIVAHKGFVWLTVTTHGVATHGSRWDIGVSAIASMGRVITACDEFDRSVLRARTHPLLGPASMHCALISGGSGLSTYAEECLLQIERRTLPGETPEQVIAEIEALLQAAHVAGDVAMTLARPPLTVASDSVIAECARYGMQRVTGTGPRDAGVGYWMDAALFAQAGIPTVNFGSHGAGAHEAVEWVDLDSVVLCAQALYHTALRFSEVTS